MKFFPFDSQVVSVTLKEIPLSNGYFTYLCITDWIRDHDAGLELIRLPEEAFLAETNPMKNGVRSNQKSKIKNQKSNYYEKPNLETTAKRSEV